MQRFYYQWKIDGTRLMIGSVYATDERNARALTGAPRHAIFRR